MKRGKVTIVYIATEVRSSMSNGRCYSDVFNELYATEESAIRAIRRMEEEYIREHYGSDFTEEELLKRVKEAQSNDEYDHGDSSRVVWYYEEQEVDE